MLFIGDDWAEAHHDIEIEDEAGRVLARRRLPEGLAGITMLHELVAEHLDPAAEPDQVLVGIETERAVGAGVAGRRLCGVRDQPVAGGAVSGTAFPVGGEVGSGRCALWPRSSGWIGRITAGSPVTVKSPNTSRSRPGRIRG